MTPVNTTATKAGDTGDGAGKTDPMAGDKGATDNSPELEVVFNSKDTRLTADKSTGAVSGPRSQSPPQQHQQHSQNSTVESNGGHQRADYTTKV